MTTVTNVIRFDAAQLAPIYKACKTVDKANAEAQKANDKRQGAYATFTALAVETGGEVFGQAMDTLFSDIRANVDGIAKKVNAQATKDGKAWQVPSAMSSAKSVLVSALELGVETTDAETGEIRAFGAIRKDVQALRKAEKDAERSDEEIARDVLRQRLVDLADALATDEPDAAMVAHYGVLTSLLNGWVIEAAEVAGEEPGEVEALKVALAA